MRRYLFWLILTGMRVGGAELQAQGAAFHDSLWVQRHLVRVEDSLGKGRWEAVLRMCDSLGDVAYAGLERQRHLVLGQACYALQRWPEADQHFQSCTENQFARGMIHAMMEDVAAIRPRHVKGAALVSKLIPGMAYLYVGDHGKAMGNFALMGGIAVASLVFWPAGIQLGILGGIDWLAQGAKRAQEVIRDGTEGKCMRCLQRILELVEAPS